MTTNRSTARLRVLIANADGVMGAITTTVDEVAQEAEQSQKAYDELLVNYRALLLKTGGRSIDTEDAPEPYVIVLVDAHSHMFRRDLLTAGTPGGSKAAKELREAVQHYLEQVFPNNGPCRIVIRVNANLEGLSATVLGDDHRALSGFANGFCSADPFFDFIDVGNERIVKTRIFETFKVSIRDPQCQHVFLAADCDANYNNVCLSDPKNGKHVSQISGIVEDPSMSRLQLKTVAFPKVFDGPRSMSASDIRVLFGICWEFEASKCVRDPCTFHHDAASETGSETVFSQLPSQAIDGLIPVNAAGHRLDVYRPQPTKESWTRFDARLDVKNPCRAFHLQNACTEALCRYDHSQIDLDMHKCLEYWASRFLCKQRGGKDKTCPYPRSMHGVDFKVHQWVPAEDKDREEAVSKVDGGDDFGSGVAYDLIDLSD